MESGVMSFDGKLNEALEDLAFQRELDTIFKVLTEDADTGEKFKKAMEKVAKAAMAFKKPVTEIDVRNRLKSIFPRMEKDEFDELVKSGMDAVEGFGARAVRK